MYHCGGGWLSPQQVWVRKINYCFYRSGSIHNLLRNYLNMHDCAAHIASYSKILRYFPGDKADGT